MVLSPWTIAVAILLGVVVGLKLPALALALKPVGETYLALLQMCATPLVICGVVASIGKILLDGHSKRYMGRLVLVIFVGLFVTAIVAILLGLVVQPGSGLSTEASRTLGRLLSTSEMQGGIVHAQKQTSLMDFLTSAVPRNIFFALGQGHQLPILFFSILLGIALGFTVSDRTKRALDLFEATFDAMLKLIEWLLYALPLGLLTLLAPQVAEAGVGVFVAMLKLIVLINVAVLVTLLIGNVIIARRTNMPYFRVLSALGESLLIAFATKNSFAAIPSTLQALQTRLGMDKHTTDLVIPLSISLNPLGNVHYYTIGAMFIAQLYNVQLTLPSLAILLVGGVLAAVAGSALPSAAAIGVFAILLDPLGLPVGSAVILIMAIDSFIDPATTVLNLHGSCVAASLVSDRAGEAPLPSVATAAPFPT